MGIKGCMRKKEPEVGWENEGKKVRRKEEGTWSRPRKAKRAERLYGFMKGRSGGNGRIRV